MMAMLCNADTTKAGTCPSRHWPGRLNPWAQIGVEGTAVALATASHVAWVMMGGISLLIADALYMSCYAYAACLR